jgi:hypothetical protein
MRITAANRPFDEDTQTMHPITALPVTDPTYATTVLDCGHVPTPPTSFHANGVPLTTGYARTRDERVICYTCAEAEERAAILQADRYSAYLSRDDKGRYYASTWTGAELMTVARDRWGAPRVSVARVGFRDVTGRSPERYTVHLIDPSGARWIGVGPGVGMYLTLRRAKGAK